EAAGALVAHAGIAVFEVVAGRVLCAPELVQLARQSARRADDRMGLLLQRAIHRAEHLRVRRLSFPGGGDALDLAIPAPRELRGLLGPGARRAPVLQAAPERLEAGIRIRH